MAHRVTFIPGDGVGPELTDASRRGLEATGAEFDWDVQEAGADVIARYGTPLPEPVLDSIRANKVAIKGPLTTPIGTGFRSVNVALRKELDLFACLRPCKLYKGVRSRYELVDLVIVRENHEDLYAGIEFEQGTDDAKRMIANLYGDILSDLAAGLVGGLGVAPGANLGDEVAVFEATHGSAPRYKGQNKVNPMAMMFSGMLMLRHLGERDAANRLENAMAKVIA